MKERSAERQASHGRAGDEVRLESGGTFRQSGAEADPAADGSGLVEGLLDLFDSAFAYIAAKLRLEQHRVEGRARELVLRVAIVLGSAVVVLLGVIFLSVGVADLIGQGLHSPASGWMTVGGFYLLAGLIALLVTSRRGSKGHRSPRHG